MEDLDFWWDPQAIKLLTPDVIKAILANIWSKRKLKTLPLKNQGSYQNKHFPIKEKIKWAKIYSETKDHYLVETNFINSNRKRYK